MIDLISQKDGVLLPVRAQPGARISAIRGVASGALKVSVTAAPEKGKANKALVQVLAKSLGLRRSQLRLVSGETSQQKRYLVRGVTAGELSERIKMALAETPSSS